MNDQQLNSFATLAQQGDLQAMWEIKGYFQSFIEELSDYSRNYIKSQEKFEEECYKILDETVYEFIPSRGNFRQLAVQSIKRRLGRARKRHQAALERYGISIISLTEQPTSDGSDEIVEFDVEDRLATVDSNLLLNEKIASLAGSDSRKLAILNLWTQPNTTDSHIAHLLAQMFGGNAESHRRYVNRFKSQCKVALACAA